MRDIVYSVKKVIRADGKTVYRAYEGHIPLEDFLSEERAWAYIDAWKAVMR